MYILLHVGHTFLKYRLLRYGILKRTSTQLISLSVWNICWSTKLYLCTNNSSPQWPEIDSKINKQNWTVYFWKNQRLTVFWLILCQYQHSRCRDVVQEIKGEDIYFYSQTLIRSNELWVTVIKIIHCLLVFSGRILTLMTRSKKYLIQPTNAQH